MKSKDKKMIGVVAILAIVIIVFIGAWSNKNISPLDDLQDCIIAQVKSQGDKVNPYSEQAWERYTDTCIS